MSLTLILLLVSGVLAPADDALLPRRPWLRWDAVDALVAEGALDQARRTAREAAREDVQDPLLLEQARAWEAWLDGALALPPEERLALIQLHAAARQPRQTAEALLLARERLLALRPQLLDQPHPRRVRLALSLAQQHRTSGRRALAAQRLASAFAAAQARWPGDHPEKAVLLAEQAAQRHTEGHAEEAWTLAGQARDLLERNGWTEGRAWILTLGQLAVLASAQGRAQDSLDTWRSLVAATADPLSEAHDSHPTLLLSLAAQLAADGQPVAARAVCQRLLDLQDQEQLPNPSRAHTWQLVAATYRRQGLLDQAEQAVGQALEVLDAQAWGEPPALRGQLLSELGLLALRQGRTSEALEPLGLAADLILAARGPHHRATFGVRQTLAHTLLDLRRFDEARAVLEDMLAGDPPPSQRAHVLADLGRLLSIADQEEQALPLLEQAAALCRDPGVEGPLRTVEHTLGYTLLRLGREREALSHLRAAAALAELQRPTPGEGRGRAGGASPYPTLATALLGAGDGAGAWEALEHARARSLLDLFAAHHGLDDPGAEEPLVGAARAAACLAPDEALMGWHDGPSRELWCWVLRADGSLSWFRSDGGRGRPDPQLGERAARQWQRLVQAEQTTGLAVDARALWDRFVEPALPALAGVRRLTVVTPEQLAGVPVTTLQDDGGRWLAERWRVTEVPSASLLVGLRDLVDDDPPLAAPRALVVADPAPAADDGTDGRAAGTRDLARDLVTRLGGATLLLDRQASEPALAGLAATGELALVDLLHLAVPGHSDPALLDRSELLLSQRDLPDPAEAVLSGGRPVDGRLSGREVLRDWRLSARLVTLSACRLAGERGARGEDLGLGEVLLAVGARNVLASRWTVDPGAARLFLDRFHAAWLDEGQPLDRALDEARRAVRAHTDDQGQRPYAHPAHWAAFVLSGAGR